MLHQKFKRLPMKKINVSSFAFAFFCSQTFNERWQKHISLCYGSNWLKKKFHFANFVSRFRLCLFALRYTFIGTKRRATRKNVRSHSVSHVLNVFTKNLECEKDADNYSLFIFDKYKYFSHLLFSRFLMASESFWNVSKLSVFFFLLTLRAEVKKGSTAS